MSEAACQFALAALEQADESLGTVSSTSDENLGESVTTVKGRLGRMSLNSRWISITTTMHIVQ